MQSVSDCVANETFEHGAISAGGSSVHLPYLQRSV
jgi:hypothetical protein